ncbi:MAG TPA: alpha/beta fold hydrolase [Polyangia bacterium]|jgi:hypothetical protein
MRRRVRLAIWAVALYAAASLAGGVFLSVVALHPDRRPITPRARAAAQSVAAQFGGRVEEVSTTAADRTVLRAWFIAPATRNGSTVMLFHGVSDCRTGMTGYADLFLSRGYAVLLPDSRAHGESGGAITTYGLRERDDIRRWKDWLADRERPACTYALGESMGAGLVLQSLAAEPGFCAVVAESGWVGLREVAFDRVAGHTPTSPFIARTLLRGPIEVGLLLARLRHGMDFSQASAADAVAWTRVPVLLIHGLRDTNIYPRHSREIAARNPSHVTLWEVPGAAHGGAMTAAPQEFERRVLGHFAAHPTPTR